MTLQYGPVKPIRGISRRKNTVRRSNFAPRGNCEQCGRPRSDASNAEGRFCGRVCAALASRHVVPSHCHVCGAVVSRGAIACWRHLHAKNQQARQRACKGCGEAFSPPLSAVARGSGKFCSLECFRKVAALRPAMVQVVCANCGTSYRRTIGAVKRNARNFCSKACAWAANVGAANASWRGGSDPNRGEGWRKIAEQIRERDGYVCRRCGKTQAENGQRLSVDHVIPWRAFEDEAEANSPLNLVALCRPCHSRKGRAERLWLLGDVLDMRRYQEAVALSWVERHGPNLHAMHVDPCGPTCRKDSPDGE